MSYAIYGDRQGAPLFALHGGADSRMIWGLLDTAASKAGVCLIAPDRPGFGDCEYVAGRSQLDHAADVIEPNRLRQHRKSATQAGLAGGENVDEAQHRRP